MDRSSKILAVATGAVLGLLLLVWIVIPRMLSSDPEESSSPGIESGKPTVADSIIRTAPEAPSVPEEPPPLSPAGQPGQPGLSPPPPTSERPQIVYAWIAEDEVQAFQGPGLNRQVVITLSYGQKVRWLEKAENWDRIQLKDGREAWVRNHELTFGKPENVEDTGPQEAVQAVTDFYAAINGRDYSAAYNLLSFDWKRDLDYARFAAGFAGTQGARVKVERVEVLTEDRIRVYVSLEVDEEEGRSEYHGSYIAVETNGEWRLDEGILEAQSRPEPPPPEEESY